MKIFVLHYTKLIDRKPHIISQFKKHNITDYEFIEKYDKEDLQDCDKSLFDSRIGDSWISIANKHMYAYKLISETCDNALIIEDDVILSDNFTKQLEYYMLQLPEDYDMLFIGNGCNLHIPNNMIVPDKHIYEKCLYPTSWGGDGASRCSDSYIISNKCAKKLCDYVKNIKYKINLHIDWWINVAARDNNFKVYWAEPTIVTQGTENGLFTSAHSSS